MARNNGTATSTKKNPFFVEEDDDDWLSSKKNGPTSAKTGSSDPFGSSDYEDYQQRLQTMKEESMNRQLDATRRCLGSIYDSEQTGVATAEELVRQGEQLDNVETKLDQVNQDLKTSAKHITSIKSVFGAIKNWWTNDGGQTRSVAAPIRSSQNSELRKTVENGDDRPSSSQMHPRLKLQQQDLSGFYEDDVSEVPKSRQTPQWKAYEKQYDDNLDMMSNGLTRLHSLGVGLGSEIDRQNDQIGRITDKTDRADTTLGHQNREINRILKK